MLIADNVLKLFLSLQFLRQFWTLSLGCQVVLRIDAGLASLIEIEQLFAVLGGAFGAPRCIALVPHKLLLYQLKIVELIDNVATSVVIDLLLR